MGTLTSNSPPPSVRHAIFAALVAWVVILPLVWTLAITKDLSHDEHQHIAAGVLLAREGLLPYRDFPFFHTPYLVFAYGVIFQIANYPLLLGRLFSTFCDASTVALLVFVSYALFRNRWNRFGVAVAASLFLLSNSLFTYTVGRAWNQDPSVFLFLLAGILYFAAIESGRINRLLFASGLCLGLAVGLRITIAPLVCPFFVTTFFLPRGEMRRIQLPAIYLIGFALALVPLAAIFLIAPKAFIFANLEFPHLAVLHREATGNPRTMTILSKLRFFVKNVVWINYPLFLAGMSTFGFWWRERAATHRLQLGLIVATFAFALLGALAPSPIFYQYFYLLAPLGLLTIVYALARIRSIRFQRVAGGVFALCLVISLVAGTGSYRGISLLLQPEKWSPLKVHQMGQQIAALADSGTVLTLAPIYPLEGNLHIYPALTTGPFAWRIAPFLSPARRQELHIAGPDELPALLESIPPIAIMTGFEKPNVEQPLLAYAREKQYILKKVGDHDIWVKAK